MKNFKLYAMAGVAGVAVVGGTFAYYSSTQTFNNQFNTTNYGSVATEKFNPKDGENWEPGEDVQKDVSVKNTGSGDIWVRVKFDEKWTKAKGGAEIIALSLLDNNFNTTAPIAGAVPMAGTNQVDVDTTDDLDGAKDGLVDKSKGEGSVVYKDIKNTVENTGIKGWYLGNDGYYYYTFALGKDAVTDQLLDHVTLCGDVDMGRQETTTQYIVAADNAFPADDAAWTNMPEAGLPENLTVGENQTVYTKKKDGIATGKEGYSGANYALNITVEITQADAAAADEFAGSVSAGQTWQIKPTQVQTAAGN